MNLRSKYGRYECKCMECAECKLIENNTNTKRYYGFCNIKNQKMSVTNHRKCKFFRKIETRTDSTAPIISSCCGCIHLSKVWHGLEPEVAFCSLRKHDVNVYEQKICSTYHRIDMQYRYSCWNSDVAEFVENLNTCGYAITTKNMVGRLALLHVFPKMSVKEAKGKTEDEIIEELGRPPFLIEHKNHLRILKRVLDVGSEAKPIVPTSSFQAESHGYIIKTYAELGVPSTLISELTGIHVNHIREYINRNGIERGKNMRKRGEIMQSVQQMTLQSNAEIVNKYGDWLDAQNKSHSTRNTMKCFAGRLLMKFNADWLVNHEECEIITQIGIPQPIKRNMFNVYSHYTRVFKEFLQQELS